MIYSIVSMDEQLVLKQKRRLKFFIWSWVAAVLGLIFLGMSGVLDPISHTCADLGAEAMLWGYVVSAWLKIAPWLAPIFGVWILIASICIPTGIIQYVARRKGIKISRVWNFIGSLGFGLITALILGIIFISLTSSARSRSPDSKRISDLRNIATILELYYDAHGHQYPNNLQLLVGEYIPAMPRDPCENMSSQYAYVYKVSDTGHAYVLRALLVNKIHPALEQDVDGVVLGVQCGVSGRENKYCVSGENLAP